jgi:hypothetical protein
MDPIEEGRWYRHREKPTRMVKVRRVWEPETEPGTLGVAFDITEPEHPVDSEWGSALDVRLFRQSYRYDPAIPDNAPFELADAISLRKKLQEVIGSLIEYNPYEVDLMELFRRLMSHENACALRDFSFSSEIENVANLIDEAVSLEEVVEVIDK